MTSPTTMNVRFFFLAIAFVMFSAKLESGKAATVQLPHFLPSPSIANHEKEKQRLEARCPPLDPCKIGHYYMDLFEKIRKGVNCPPQPQRCSTTASTTPTSTTRVVKLAAATTTEISPKLNYTVFLCQYLERILEKQSFMQMYIEVMKSIGCLIRSNSTMPVVPA